MNRTAEQPQRREHERGSSLFEVTLALGLLAGVLGSIAGLFVVGAGSVKSGRLSSEALSIARTIVEETQSWDLTDLYENFGFDGTSSTVTADTRTTSGTEAWRAEIAGRLPGAHATISVSSLEPGSPQLTDSAQMRVMVTVFWVDGNRDRRVRLGTVKM